MVMYFCCLISKLILFYYNTDNVAQVKRATKPLYRLALVRWQPVWDTIPKNILKLVGGLFYFLCFLWSNNRLQAIYVHNYDHY